MAESHVISFVLALLLFWSDVLLGLAPQVVVTMYKIV